jgi:Tfp pilus assembly protein PilF
MALEGVGRSHEAIQQFRIATGLKPDDTQARYGLARALVRSGNLPEGLENFRQVAEADTHNTELRDEFGEFLMRQGKPAEALVQFNAALAIDPAEKTALHDRDLALKQLQAQ